MKRIFLILLSFCCIQIFANAKETENVMPSVKYNGKQYSLHYSAKVKEINGYTNEYFKAKETYDNWSELLAVHHFPNDFYPVEKAKEFQTYLANLGCTSHLLTNDEDNTAIIDFLIVDNSRLPIIAESNIFKYKKDSVCGTLAMQYAKRYRINNSLELEKMKKIIEKDRVKSLKKLEKLEFPELVTKPIENGKYIVKDIKSAEVKDILNTDVKNEEKELPDIDVKNEGIINPPTD